MRRIDRWLFSLYAARAASSTSRTFFSLLFSVSLYFMCVYNNVIENTKKSSRSTRPAFFLTLFRLLFLLFKNPCRYISSSYFFIIRRSRSHSFFVELWFECKNPSISFPRLLRFDSDFHRVWRQKQVSKFHFDHQVYIALYKYTILVLCKECTMQNVSSTYVSAYAEFKGRIT